jgi:hypothetical protein
VRAARAIFRSRDATGGAARRHLYVTEVVMSATPQIDDVALEGPLGRGPSAMEGRR